MWEYEQYTRGERSLSLVKSNPNFDCNYNFSIDLAPNGKPCLMVRTNRKIAITI